jgi:hypothetical protein
MNARIGCYPGSGSACGPVEIQKPVPFLGRAFRSWCHPSSALLGNTKPCVNVQGLVCQPHSLGCPDFIRTTPRLITVADPAQATAFAFALQLRGPFRVRAAAGFPPLHRLSEERRSRTRPHQRFFIFYMDREYISLIDTVKTEIRIQIYLRYHKFFVLDKFSLSSSFPRDLSGNP